MSRLKLIIDFLAYSDNSQTNDPQDVSRIKSVLEESSFTELIRRKATIADGTTDQNISFSVSDYILIFSDQTITIKLNGSGDSLTLVPETEGKKSFVFFQKGTINSLLVSNNSGNAVKLDIITVDK